MVLADDPETIKDLRSASTSGSINLLLDRDAEAPKLTFVFNTARPPFLDPVARHAVRERDRSHGDDRRGI